MLKGNSNSVSPRKLFWILYNGRHRHFKTKIQPPSLPPPSPTSLLLVLLFFKRSIQRNVVGRKEALWNGEDICLLLAKHVQMKIVRQNKAVTSPGTKWSSLFYNIYRIKDGKRTLLSLEKLHLNLRPPDTTNCMLFLSSQKRSCFLKDNVTFLKTISEENICFLG